MSPTYFLVINGRPEGPFSLEQLKDLNIRPGDFVKSAGMDDYKEVREIAELRELLGFSVPAFTPQYFGSFDQRLLASALDWFIVAGFCIIPAFLISLFIKGTENHLLIALSLLVIIPVIKFIYHIVMECSPRQATFGKQILAIKVCDMQGKRISFGRAVGRNLAKVFSALPFFIGYLFSFFNKQQQCLHDMIAGTLVVKDRLF